MRKTMIRRGSMSRLDIWRRRARRAWNDDRFWTLAGERLAAWGIYAVMLLAAVLIVAGRIRLGCW